MRTDQRSSARCSTVAVARASLRGDAPRMCSTSATTSSFAGQPAGAFHTRLTVGGGPAWAGAEASRLTTAPSAASDVSTAASLAVIGHCPLEGPGLIDAGNAASLRVAAKLGFTFESETELFGKAVGRYILASP
jgi:hypothetical protein